MSRRGRKDRAAGTSGAPLPADGRALPASSRGASYSSAISPILGFLLVQSGLLAAIYLLARFNAPPVILTPFDVVALPGEKVTLLARLERPGSAFDASPGAGARAVFEPLAAVPEQPPAAASFDETRTAAVALEAPRTPGIHNYQVRLEGEEPPRTPPLREDLLLEVLAPERSAVFVLVPDSLSGEDDFVSLQAGRIALQALGAGRAVVYLATRRHASSSRVRRWIAARGLPPGPVLTASRAVRPATSAARGLDEILAENIAEIIARSGLSRWKTGSWAIVESAQGALAFAAAGIRAVHLSSSPSAPPGASPLPVQQAGDWNQARKIVEGSR